MKEKTFVITGASSGIGEALALAYAAHGNKLVLAARSKSELERVAVECEKVGGKTLIVPTDVADPEACKALMHAAMEKFGSIDVLVNNAGVSMRAMFRDVTDLTLFERLMKINYLGSVYCTHYALEHLIASKGLLVAISSLTGKTGVPSRTGYAASKHAMQGFFDSLRIELLETGVDVLVASPGFVDSGIRTRALGTDGKPRGGDTNRVEPGTMSLEECTTILTHAIDHRQREVVMTSKARLALWIKLIAPRIVDEIALKEVRGKGA
jgi:short-subunit dehydrogenase